MKTPILNFKRVIISTALSCVLLTQATQAQSVAVFGLLESKSETSQNNSIKQLEKQARPLGCALRREGKIIKAQGNYDVPDINGFFLLECETSFLESNLSSHVIEGLKDSTENLMLVEGPVSQFGSFGLAKSGNNNSYIFKLSDYNNISIEQRNRDLMKLGSLVKTRKDRYKTEAFIRVTDAYGMQRPDEVVVIYYDSPEAGERFRANDKNADIMALLGKFNKEHLTQASYLIAQSNR
jgi:hypothetical protein